MALNALSARLVSPSPSPLAITGLAALLDPTPTVTATGISPRRPSTKTGCLTWRKPSKANSPGELPTLCPPRFPHYLICPLPFPSVVPIPASPSTRPAISGPRNILGPLLPPPAICVRRLSVVCCGRTDSNVFSGNGINIFLEFQIPIGMSGVAISDCPNPETGERDAEPRCRAMVRWGPRGSRPGDAAVQPV